MKRGRGEKHARRRRPLHRRLLFALLYLLAAWLVLTWGAVLVLRFVPPPTTAFMLERQFHAWRRHQDDFRLRYHWVPWQAVAPVVPLAMIASEDQKFPFHHGFDVQSIHNAIEDAEDGERLRGASTISQQTAKNLFLWGGRSFVRKGLEAYFTVLLEVTWPKQRILTVYMNIVELGDGIYGVDAASRAFFHQSPSAVTRRQAALLAAVLPNPRKLHAAAPSDYVSGRADWIVGQMQQLGGVGYLDNL
ncbi:MAG TPA: monofunctional biosynthetic peptidoglycan transglycosylase [Rhodanobacteraceae bacterium]|nr:monofunctional biosynthetic peptidoglycan transglycosylase [Rhodanobacteraceae bacterium]